LALSSRRPYDENYSLFVELLARQIATSLSNVQLLEEEIRRVQELAEIDRRKGEELQVALAQRTKELHASQGFMGRLAEICPVGIFVSDASGNITFVNDTWVQSMSFLPTLVTNHIIPPSDASVELDHACSS
jgi:GAF domain-containing protein